MLTTAQEPVPTKTFEQQYSALASSTFLLTFSAACYSIFLGSYHESRNIPYDSSGLTVGTGNLLTMPIK